MKACLHRWKRDGALGGHSEKQDEVQVMKTKETQNIKLDFFSRPATRAQHNGGLDFARKVTRQAVAGGLMLFMVPLSIGDVFAQGPPPPPPDQQYGGDQYGGQQGYEPLPPQTIDQLVAPIALYPDSLVAQVLAGATYPAQLASAEQFVNQYQGMSPDQLAQMADQQPWDPSVKALVAFPQVLSNLNQNIQWTTQLGNAYYNQPQDVMNAVQQMRQRAYDAGNLRSNQQLAVEYNPGAIVIEPASPSVVYVPYYNPWIVYGAPIPEYGYYHYYGPPRGVGFGVGLAIGFGVGIAIGAFGHFGWGYHNWQPDWHSRTVVYNHNTYISNSVTVVNHGNYGAFDRNPQARAFNHTQAVHYANVNHTTINNVSVNRTNNNFNRVNGNTGPGNNGGRNFNTNGGRPGQPINGAQRPGQPGQPGQFNNGANGGARPGQPGGFNNGANGGARPGQPGQFNNGANSGARPGQGGQFNNGSRPAGQPGGFNNGARPNTAQPGQFGGARPAQPSAQPNFNRGAAPNQARPSAPAARPQSSPAARPSPQQHAPAAKATPHQESHGHEGGGEHHH